MSTADSQILVSASTFTEILQDIHKKAIEKELILMGRSAVITVLAIDYLIARDPNNSVMGLIERLGIKNFE